MYTYNIQLAGYDYNQFDEKGEVEIQTFIDIIEQFPWIEELEKNNQIYQGCSATVSVINHNTNNILWISIAGDKNKYNYLIGYVYPKETKSFLGLGKVSFKKWVDIYSVSNFALVKEFFLIFFNGDEVFLNKQLSLEEKFQSMKAKVY